MYYKGNICNIVLLENAKGIRGSVWLNSDDSYTVFIDASLSAEEQKKVFEHEMNHIINNDFQRSSVQRIEAYAHKIFKN